VSLTNTHCGDQAEVETRELRALLAAAARKSNDLLARANEEAAAQLAALQASFRTREVADSRALALLEEKHAGEEVQAAAQVIYNVNTSMYVE
jgi:hypothetical protein